MIESIIAVRDIVAKYPGPYTLMLSGGVDSQAMLWAWHLSGIPFEAVSFRFENDFNIHDVETIERFIECTQIPIKIQVKYLDVIDFLENSLPEYSDKYECSSPQICTHMRMCEEITEGTIVFSGNFAMTPSRNGPMLSYAILGIQRYAQRTGKSIIPFFFLHTKELAYSFIKFDDVGLTDSYEMKVNMYRAAGFPVMKQKEKYTGFEKIKDYYDSQKDRVSIKTRLKFAGKPSTRNFDLLFRYPYELKINDPRIDYHYSFLKKD